MKERTGKYSSNSRLVVVFDIIFCNDCHDNEKSLFIFVPSFFSAAFHSSIIESIPGSTFDPILNQIKDYNYKMRSFPLLLLLVTISEL